MDRRGFLKLLLGSAVAEATVDWERLLWVPKPIITVPALPLTDGQIVASAWEAYVGIGLNDNIFARYWFAQPGMTTASELKKGVWLTDA